MKQNNAFTFCIQLLFLSFFTVPIFAQTDTLKQPMNRLGVPEVITGKAIIEEKVIGASRSVRKLEDLPVTVYIISQEDILKNGYTTLTDVLKMVPGIRVSQPGNGVNGETFLMRGLEGNTYTKILLNNLPIQPTVSSTLSIGEQLPIAQVERIEVIYGSASAVYGADAMVGVINIITKGTQNSTFANVNAVVGDYGYRHVNFMAGGKIGRDKNIIQYSFFGNQGSRQKLNITDGEYQKVFSPIRSEDLGLFDKSDTEIVEYLRQNPNPNLENRLRFGFPFYQGTALNATLSDMPQESYLLAGNIKYRNFQLSYYDMYRSSHSSLGRQPLFFGYQDEGNRIMEKTQIIALNYTKSWEKLTATANIMYLRHRYNPQSSMATNYTNLGKSYVFQASDDLFAEVVLNYNLTKKWELTGGVSYKVASTLPTTNDLRQPFDTDEYRPFTNYQPKPDSIFGNFGYNPTIVNNFGTFAQAYFSSQRWNIVLGWRFDSPSNYDARSYQRIAVLYKTSPKTSIRVSGGYAFKAPSLTTAYQSVAIQDLHFDSLLQRPVATGKILYQVLPNPNLDPEESAGVDIGFRYAINSTTYIDIVGFTNVVNNLIIASTDTILPNDPRFPKSVPNVARTFKNNNNTQSFLTGLQVVARAKNIVPAIQLQTNFSYTLQVGVEVFDEKLQEINQYRQVPVHTLQWSIGMNLTKKWYINFENVAMTGWYRRYIPNVQTDLDQQFINGYYTLDFLSRYQFNKNLGAYLKIVNVFDTKYGGLSATGLDVDLHYMPQLGRNIQFGVSFQLE